MTGQTYKIIKNYSNHNTEAFREKLTFIIKSIKDNLPELEIKSLDSFFKDSSLKENLRDALIVKSRTSQNKTCVSIILKQQEVDANTGKFSNKTYKRIYNCQITKDGIYWLEDYFLDEKRDSRKNAILENIARSFGYKNFEGMQIYADTSIYELLADLICTIALYLSILKRPSLKLNEEKEKK